MLYLAHLYYEFAQPQAIMVCDLKKREKQETITLNGQRLIKMYFKTQEYIVWYNSEYYYREPKAQ